MICTESGNNDPDCVTEPADSDSNEQSDNDPDCVEKEAEILEAKLFGTVIVMRENEECEMFVMCSPVLALGRETFIEYCGQGPFFIWEHQNGSRKREWVFDKEICKVAGTDLV